jgi:hypothetical protein
MRKQIRCDCCGNWITSAMWLVNHGHNFCSRVCKDNFYSGKCDMKKTTKKLQE